MSREKNLKDAAPVASSRPPLTRPPRRSYIIPITSLWGKGGKWAGLDPSKRPSRLCVMCCKNGREDEGSGVLLHAAIIHMLVLIVTEWLLGAMGDP